MTDLEKEELNEISGYASDLIRLRGKLRASITKIEILLNKKKEELRSQRSKLKDIQRMIEREGIK